MTNSPASSASPIHRHSSAPDAAKASGFLRRLVDARLRAEARSGGAEDIEARVQARTAELEREIARLRQENDRRLATQRELERARTAAEATVASRAALFAALSHELRAPVYGIVGTLDVLRGTALTDEQGELLQLVRQSGEWLLAIVNDILDFSRIESGGLTLEAIEFDLADELQFAIDVHGAAAARKSLEFVVDVHGVDGTWRGDPSRLRQILVNLLSNAVKFTAQGEITLRVRRAERAAERVRFEIVDTGVGIPPDMQTAIFEPFVQASAATARTFGGTGLGLAICRRLVELMGGEIGVSSTAGAGATFWFEIPLEPVGARTTDAAATSASLAGCHVLIVDDNETNRNVFSRLATGWKMTVGTAATAEAALAYLIKAAASLQPVDLVVLDHEIHGTDGLAVAHAIRSEARLRAPALAMLTPRTRRRRDDELGAAGIAVCERKPIHPKRLEAMLTRALQHRGASGVRHGSERVESNLPTSRVADRGPEVLVLESNAICQKVIRLQLQSLSCSPRIVTTGSDVLAALHEGSYPLVLLSQRMPGGDEHGILCRIREAQLAGRYGLAPRLRVVAVTSSALTGDREACLAAGFDDHIAKPITPAALDALLARCQTTAARR